MSSKRARRKKRQENSKVYNPNKKPDKVIKEERVVKLPGQTMVRVGSGFLLISGAISACLIYFALKSMNDMNSAQFMFLTGMQNENPMSYSLNLMLTSVAGVFQFLFGYNIFKESKNPFYAKTAIIMSVIMIIIEVSFNIIVGLVAGTGFKITMLTYGTIFPIAIIWGSYKNMKFAKKHPDYKPPESVQMF